MNFYKKSYFWIIFAFCYAIIVARHEKIPFHDEGNGRSWYYGDKASALNVESAAKYYIDSGFSKNAGLPVYQYTTSNQDYVYTHYPPLAEWIGGGLAYITGHWDAYSIAFLPLILSVILFFIIFIFLNEILPNKKASFLSASILVLSNYFLCWADDIHQHLYIELFKWLYVYIYWKYLTSSNRKVISVIVLALLYFGMCLLSFEPYVYIFIVNIGLALVYRKKIFSIDLILLTIVPVCAFAFRLYLNSIYFGGIEAMITDITSAFGERIGVDKKHSEIGRTMHLNDYLVLLPKTRIQRLGHFFIFPSLVLIYFYCLAFIHFYQSNRLLFKIAIVFFIASLSWCFIMPQHALVHLFTLRHNAIFLGIILGYGILEFKKIVQTSYLEKKYFSFGFHAILAMYSVVYVFVNTVYSVYLQYGLLYPHLGIDKIEILNHFLF